MISARQALERLQAGNLRFVSGSGRTDVPASRALLSEPSAGQEPFAAILGCSDSRAPTEMLFDQGLGDLFVVRVAGNIAGPSQIGSVEFATDKLGARLVVVLGHSHCGAVIAAVEELTTSSVGRSAHLRSILDQIRPAVEPLLAPDFQLDEGALLQAAVQANVRAAVSKLRRESRVLERLIADEGLAIVGAEYALETGAVEFLAGESV